MTQHWRIQVKGKQRKQVDVDLIVQAILALGRQLADEQRPAEAEPSAEAMPHEDNRMTRREAEGTP